MSESSTPGSEVTDSVVAHALTMRNTPLPASAAAAARSLLLDAAGVGIAGSSTPESAAVRRAVLSWGSGSTCLVWGSRERLPVPSAALVNAHQMHCLEFDAIHEPSVVHPMTVVFPVVAAYAQQAAAAGHPVDGERFLRAIAVGVDVAAGLGEVATSPLQFFRPATAGALGSVLALVVAANAAPEIATAAFGIVYGALSGTMQPHHEGDGVQLLPLQVGFAARSALSSWDLAHAGLRGPRRVLEGTFGYFRLIEASGQPELLARRLGSQWEVERTSIKPFPSGRATHGVLDAVLTLQAEHGFAADDVQRLEAFVPSMVNSLVGRQVGDSLTPGEARLCLRYLVAHALHNGDVQLNADGADLLRAPAVLELARRVDITVDANPDPNAFDPQRVRIDLRDGRSLQLELERSLGSPARPVDPERLERKFRANLEAAGRSADADRILQLARDITDLPDAAVLIEAM